VNRCVKILDRYMCGISDRVLTSSRRYCNFRDEASVRNMSQCKFAKLRDHPPFGRWEFTCHCTNLDACADKKLEEL